MKLKKLLIFFFITTPIYAQLPENIRLEADTIAYQNKSKLLLASSNVRLNYQNLNVVSPSFYYDSENAIIRFNKGLLLKNSNQQATATFLEYNYKTNNGSAKSIKIKTDNLTLTAEKIAINPLKTQLENTEISNCTLEKKHIYITSKKVDIYPLLGVLNAKRNHLHIRFLPFKIPILFIPYRSKESNLMENTQYFPKFGKNEIYGNYAIYKLSYTFNQFLAGTLDLGYTKNLKWLIGGSNSYFISNFYTHNLGIHYYPDKKQTAFYTLSTFKIKQKKKNESKSNILDSLIKPFYKSDSENIMEIDIIGSQNDIINSLWIDQLPKIEIKFLNRQVINTTINTHLSYANTTEKDLLNYSKNQNHIKLNNTIQKELPINNYLSFVPTLDFLVNHYNNQQSWNKLFFNYKIKINSRLNPEISYNQKIINHGESPFKYEQKYALTESEIGIKISESNSRFVFELETNYALKSQDFRKQKILFIYKLHCWGIGTQWDLKENAFALQFIML